MKRSPALFAALPWAAAIIAAALADAPAFFSQILLPVLAVTSLLPRADSCLTRSAAP